ncbi:cytochrome P450 [Phakopsora pachyrhizi]|nr:cytochrome P450 [Phakopsora pachyrhizi]KAI8452311.1 cytochrome P450 [Phakopsora pachyrhizi]
MLLSDLSINLKEIVGILLPEVVVNSRNLLEWAAKKQRKYGLGYSVTMPGLRVIEISRPDWIEHVQKTNFQNYVKGSLFQEVMSDVFGQGIFVTDGASWKSSRQTTTRIFSATTFKTIITPSVHQTLNNLVEVLNEHSESGDIAELDSLFHHFTLEAFVKMTFSQDMNCLRASNIGGEKDDSFEEAFDYVQQQLDLRFVFTAIWVRLGRFIANRPKMVSSIHILEDYAYKLIDARDTKSVESESPKDLLSLFKGFIDEKGVSMRRSELKDALLNLIIAGRDTTAQALSWCFFHLIRKPEHLDIIRAEIENLLPCDESKVDYENYKDFTKTLAVFYEAVRLHPPVAKNAKFAVKHDKLPNGPLVEPGDCLRWSDWQMARDPDIWGNDCTEFLPSRWIDSDGKLKQFGQWKFHAFNGGPRICIGMHLATLEAVTVLVELIRNFDFQFERGWFEKVPKISKISPDSTEITPRYASSLTHPMAKPLRVIVHRRSKTSTI